MATFVTASPVASRAERQHQAITHAHACPQQQQIRLTTASPKASARSFFGSAPAATARSFRGARRHVYEPVRVLAASESPADEQADLTEVEEAVKRIADLDRAMEKIADGRLLKQEAIDKLNLPKVMLALEELGREIERIDAEETNRKKRGKRIENTKSRIASLQSSVARKKVVIERAVAVSGLFKRLLARGWTFAVLPFPLVLGGASALKALAALGAAGANPEAAALGADATLLEFLLGGPLGVAALAFPLLGPASAIYGVFSSSWDPERAGSLLGLGEFKNNRAALAARGAEAFPDPDAGRQFVFVNDILARFLGY
eukprot:tig00000789_g4104.t1